MGRNESNFWMQSGLRWVGAEDVVRMVLYWDLGSCVLLYSSVFQKLKKLNKWISCNCAQSLACISSY